MVRAYLRRASEEHSAAVDRAEVVSEAVEAGEQAPPQLPRGVRPTRAAVFLDVIREDAAKAEMALNKEIERLRSWAAALFWSHLATALLAVAGAAAGVALLYAGRLALGAVSVAVPPLAIFGVVRLQRSSNQIEEHARELKLNC